MRLDDNDLVLLLEMERKLGPPCDWQVIHGNEVVDEDGEEIAYAASGHRADERAEFIAETRNALRYLVAEVREARESMRCIVDGRASDIEDAQTLARAYLESVPE